MISVGTVPIHWLNVCLQASLCSSLWNNANMHKNLLSVTFVIWMVIWIDCTCNKCFMRTPKQCLYQQNSSTVYPKKYAHVFALLCFVVVMHWLIFPYPSGLLHWHCGNLTIAPVPAKQPWWIWINTSCEFIMNDCITTTKQSTTKPCAYFLGYTVNKTNVWHAHSLRCHAKPHV